MAQVATEADKPYLPVTLWRQTEDMYGEALYELDGLAVRGAVEAACRRLGGDPTSTRGAWTTGNVALLIRREQHKRNKECK